LTVNTGLWDLRAVAAVLAARIGLAWLVGKMGVIPGLWLQMLDRVLVVGLVAFVVLNIYHASLDSMGWVGNPLWRNMALGLAAGVLLLGVANYTSRIVGLFMADLPEHPLMLMARLAESPTAFMLPFLLGGIVTPVSEEVFYRGFAYPAFRRRFGIIWGVALAALFFAMMHFSLRWLGEILVVGVGLTLLFQYTGSLLPGIVAHSLINSVRLLAAYMA